MLRTKWEMILSSLGSMLEENPAFRWMNHVLNLSYNDLPHDLKTCMLYLVSFPEDSIIRKDHLLRRWIAEGFVMEIPSQDLEDIAEGYLTELINRSMIQPASFGEGGELMSVRVHDLMLELITSKSRQENFITTTNDLKARPGALEIRRLSLHFSNAEDDNVLGSMELKQTRSLIFSGIVQDIPCIRKFE
uniref:Disease resistance protein winged helix domain-containing protein n=1 Tax=Triticum urartu TaxID=4572 RepID=A0A8R7U040_TRIUA